MRRSRAKDWFIGAVGMLVLLVLGVAVLWWLASTPTGDARSRSTQRPSGGTAERAEGRPPAHLGADEVWLGDLRLRSGTVVTPDARLRDVRAVGHDVVTGPDGLIAERVDVDATVPFDVVADELGGDSVVRASDGGQATVVRTVEALGRELRVEATGTVEVADGKLVVEPRSIDVGGPEFLSGAIAAVVRQFVTIEQEVAGLPDGLVLQDVTVRDDGFRAHLAGRDVALLP
jgi:hypothetical protein